VLLGGPASAQQLAVSPYSPLPAVPIPVSGPVWLYPAPSAPPLQVGGTVTPVRYQPGPLPRPGDDERRTEYQIQLEPPGLERLSRLDSDETLQERIRQETRARDANERVEFPLSPILSRDKYTGRRHHWQQRQLTVEPDFTFYHKLLFEDKNTERYGWELGELQPLLSAGKFFLDFALLPLKAGNMLCVGCTECSTGYCLPGDPVPLLLYPPEVTLTGTVVELGTIAALIAIFP
jgi:hypothetical protein